MMQDKITPLINRIKKNYQHVSKWAKRTETNCFRIYDKDIKEHPFAIDFYAGRFLVHYFTDCERQEMVEEVIRSLFGEVPIYSRVRVQRKRTEQYEKLQESKKFFEVKEYGVGFWVNLEDYLDTGLFLDHRETRQRVARLAEGKSLLNLFAYTCSFSVQAAVKGAQFTRSVDLSNTYLAWGKKNFSLNGIPVENHSFVRADCLQFLEQEERSYDLIVIDPPTVSRSKKMDQMFDIAKDYPYLLNRALSLLKPQGTIFFSTNSRKFDLDPSLFAQCTIEDISAKTIPLDFHDQKVHYCWKISNAVTEN